MIVKSQMAERAAVKRVAEKMEQRQNIYYVIIFIMILGPLYCVSFAIAINLHFQLVKRIKIVRAVLSDDLFQFFHSVRAVAFVRFLQLRWMRACVNCADRSGSQPKVCSVRVRVTVGQSKCVLEIKYSKNARQLSPAVVTNPLYLWWAYTR